MGQDLSIQEHAMVAIHDDDVRNLMYYISKGAIIDDEKGLGLLLYAATNDSLECARYLVSQGVSPFKKTNGLSFYEYAIQQNNQGLLQIAHRGCPPRLHVCRRKM